MPTKQKTIARLITILGQRAESDIRKILSQRGKPSISKAPNPTPRIVEDAKTLKSCLRICDRHHEQSAIGVAALVKAMNLAERSKKTEDWLLCFLRTHFLQDRSRCIRALADLLAAEGNSDADG